MSSCSTAQEKDHCDKLNIGVVLLAAGEGSRMGSIPKCLLRLEGVPLIQRHLTAMQQTGIDEVVVVTGFYHEQIEPALADFSVKLVRNPYPEQGQQSSVKLGLESVSTACELVMVVLADQPLVGKTELKELISAFKHRPAQTCVVYPEADGQRGNPVAFSGQVIASMLASGTNIGCRKFIDANPELVHILKTENAHFILDLDTAADVAAFEMRTGMKLEPPVGHAV
jgi:CTP:molybdopterin cytidylyltransferase MocA